MIAASAADVLADGCQNFSVARRRTTISNLVEDCLRAIGTIVGDTMEVAEIAEGLANMIKAEERRAGRTTV